LYEQKGKDGRHRIYMYPLMTTVDSNYGKAQQLTKRQVQVLMDDSEAEFLTEEERTASRLPTDSLASAYSAAKRMRSAASPSARSARGHSGTDGKLSTSARDRAGRDRAARPPSARATPRRASGGRKSGRFKVPADFQRAFRTPRASAARDATRRIASKRGRLRRAADATALRNNTMRRPEPRVGATTTSVSKHRQT